MKPKTRNFLVYRLPAIIWTVVVLFASSATFSGAQTGRFLELILGWLFTHVPHGLLVVAHITLRKLAHLAEYGVLAWLLYRARGDTHRVWDLQWARFALAGVLIIATLDEVHQHFVPSRVGSPIDVVIDIVGALAALLILRRLASRDRAGAPAIANQ